jgi:2-(1,2-epoxy-1,2-dihydrophenyl)acetyl-CoA isomerase
MSKTSDQPVLTSRDGSVAHIRLNRPHVLNALDQAMAEALLAAVQVIAADAAVRCVVLSGAGRSFMAGGDVAAMHQAGHDAPAFAARLIAPLHRALELLAACHAPVLASVQGPVAGAGVSLLLAADLAIAADDLHLTLAYPRIGASPDGSSTFTLPRIVGLRRAMEIALLSDPIPAQEALRLELVNRVVPLAELPAATEVLARRLADGPTRAFAATRKLLRGSFDRTLAEQLDAEAEAFLATAATADFREGTAAFAQKRRARFTGA